MRHTWFRTGKWNAICEVCGFKFKDTDLRKRWDGLMVCERDWEQRHPQELLRPVPDQVKLPWTRPEGKDQFIQLNYSVGLSCTPFGMTCQADYMSADCATVDNVIASLIPV